MRSVLTLLIYSKVSISFLISSSTLPSFRSFCLVIMSLHNLWSFFYVYFKLCAIVLTILCHGSFFSGPFWCFLCASCMYINVSYLNLGKFSSVITLNILSMAFTWDSSHSIPVRYLDFSQDPKVSAYSIFVIFIFYHSL